MSLIKEKFDLDLPLSSIFLEDWKDRMKGCDNLSFDNLDHFIYLVSKLSQKDDKKCGMSYNEAIKKLTRKESDFPKSEQESIRNLVRKNLFKRGLITEEIYENYKYSTDGTQVGVDVAKYASGEADCVITPSKQYIDFFYEMYINISYPYSVSNEDVRTNVAKLLATVEELERQHVFIKINTLFPNSQPREPNTVQEGKTNKFFSSIPIFSHRDYKSVDLMSSIINDRLLRKFYFAILEDVYGEDLVQGYGYPIKLPQTLNIGEEFDEIELFQDIKSFVGA